MTGVIDARAWKTNRLGRFGYITLTAKTDGGLFRTGEQIRAHEFHYYDSSDNGDGFTAAKPSGRKWRCVHASSTLYAGFPHLYFPANPAFAERFVRKAAQYVAD